MPESLTSLRVDCRHFRGHVPCRPHKLHGVHCSSCGHYEPTRERILIIKLGAIGDVIRTTPLLHPLKKQFPQARISWITHTPEVAPEQMDDDLNRAVTKSYLQELFFNRVIASCTRLLPLTT